MTARVTSNRWRSLPCSAALLAIAVSASSLRAQEPMLNAVNPGTPLGRIVLQREPQPAAPEAPQGNGNAPSLKDDLFAGTEKFAKNATDATEVNMDPDSLDLVGGNEAHKAHRMLLTVVRSYSYDKPGMYNPADVEEFRRKLETGDWHCSVHTRNLKTGETTDVCSRRRAPDMIENAIITVAPKELTFIHNIRKANGQGGGLDLGGFGGMAMIPGLPPLLSMNVTSSAWKAEMLASPAVLRAEMPAMMDWQREFKVDVPMDLHLFNSMREFKFEMSPERRKRMDELQKKLGTPPAPSKP